MTLNPLEVKGDHFKAPISIALEFGEEGHNNTLNILKSILKSVHLLHTEFFVQKGVAATVNKLDLMDFGNSTFIKKMLF